MKVYEAIAEFISKLGYNHVYTIPGTHIYHLNHSLNEVNVMNIIFRHEMGTTMAADAYGRLTGEPGIAVDTAGPGILNGLSGVGQAFAEASPLIYITGETRKNEYFGFHGLDNPLYTSRASIPVTKATHLARDPKDAYEALKKLYTISILGRRGPVHLAIPYEILQGDIEGVDHEIDSLYSYEETPKEFISFINERYRGKKVLYVLGPEVYVEHRDKIDSLLKDKLFLTTTSMTGFIPQNHDGYIGFIEKNFQVYPPAEKVLKMVDIVVLIGLDPRSPETNLIKRINNSLEIDTIQMSWIYRLDEIWGNTGEDWTIKRYRYGYSFRGDIIGFLEQLSTLDTPKLDIDINKLKMERRDEAYNIISHEKSSFIHQGRLAYTLSNMDIDGYVITCDTGGNEQWIREFIAPYRLVRYLYSGGFGAIGYSLPASIGAYMAINKTGYRGVISVVGDGSILMSLQELKTIVEYDINVKIIVFNDSSYGILEMLSKRDIGVEIKGDIGSVDFSKVSEGIGMEALRVEDEEYVEEAIKDLLRSSKAMLLDIRTSPKEVPTLLRK